MSKNIDKLAELALRRSELVEELKSYEERIRMAAQDVAAESLQSVEKPATRRGRKPKTEALPRISTVGSDDQSDHMCMVIGNTDSLEAAACLLTLWSDGECLSVGDVTQRALEPGFAAANGLSEVPEEERSGTVKSWIVWLTEAGKLTRSGKGRGTVYSVTMCHIVESQITNYST